METRSREKRQPTGKEIRPTSFDEELVRLVEALPTIDTNHIIRLMPQYSEDWIRRRLREHYHEDNNPDEKPYLRRSPDQWKHGNKNYRSVMYEATPTGKAFTLRTRGPLVPHKRSGSFGHMALEMRVIASLMIACKESPDHEFIEPEEILEDAPESTRKRPFPFAIPIGESVVQPDWRGIFGIDYKGSMMAFAFEADNRSERNETTNMNVRSFTKIFREWDYVYKHNLHRSYLNQPSFMVPIVCPSKVRLDNAMELLAKMAKTEGTTTRPFLFKAIESFKDYWLSPRPHPEMLFEPWKRVNHPDFYLSTLSERKLDQQATSLNNN